MRRRGVTLFFAATLAVVALLTALSAGAFAGTFTPGQDGHPFNGPYSDLKGGTASFTFENSGAGAGVLNCDKSDTATAFAFTIDYSVTGTMPAGATVVIYLSPNQGAINGNAGSNEQAYIDAVESNYFVWDVGGLTGSGTKSVSFTVTTPFTLVTGGVLGVFATESNGTEVSNSKTNSLNCTEASPSPVTSTAPSEAPSTAPSEAPSTAPSDAPSTAPSEAPSTAPSEAPSTAPSEAPSTAPSEAPSPEESVGGVTAAPSQAASPSPAESVGGATSQPQTTPPPTSTSGPTSNGSTPLFVFLILVAFAGLGVLTVRAQKVTNN